MASTARHVGLKVTIDVGGNAAAAVAQVREQITQLQNASKVQTATNQALNTPAGKAQQMLLAHTAMKAQSAQIQGQIATVRARSRVYGTAPHLQAERDRYELQNVQKSAEARRARAAGQAQAGLIGSRDHMQALREEIAARKQLTSNLRAEKRAGAIAEHGELGGPLVLLGERMGELASRMTRFSIIGGAAGVSAVASASPQAFQTLTGSLRLAAGEIGITLIPAVLEVSIWLQRFARTFRNVNEALGGFPGKLIATGAVLGTLAFVGAKVLSFLRPLGVALGWMTVAENSSAAALTGVTVAANAAALALGRLAGVSAVGQAAGAIGTAAAAGTGALAGRAGAAAAGTTAAAAAAAGSGATVAGRTLAFRAGQATATAGGALGAMGAARATGYGTLALAAVNAFRANRAAARGDTDATMDALEWVPFGRMAVGRQAWETQDRERQRRRQQSQGTGIFSSLSPDERGQLAVSMNFQQRSYASQADFHHAIQQDALRDPMQQAQFEQQIRALREIRDILQQRGQTVPGVSWSSE